MLWQLLKHKTHGHGFDPGLMLAILRHKSIPSTTQKRNASRLIFRLNHKAWEPKPQFDNF